MNVSVRVKFIDNDTIKNLTYAGMRDIELFWDTNTITGYIDDLSILGTVPDVEGIEKIVVPLWKRLVGRVIGFYWKWTF